MHAYDWNGGRISNNCRSQNCKRQRSWQYQWLHSSTDHLNGRLLSTYTVWSSQIYSNGCSTMNKVYWWAYMTRNFVEEEKKKLPLNSRSVAGLLLGEKKQNIFASLQWDAKSFQKIHQTMRRAEALWPKVERGINIPAETESLMAVTTSRRTQMIIQELFFHEQNNRQL